MRRVLVVLVLFCVALHPTSVGAIGLKVNPPEYTVTLKEGEKQKGYIDISNPSGEAVKVETSVQAFKQTDNKGTLQFYDDEQLKEGVLLDLASFEIAPRGAMRMFFVVDGTKLPRGDVFGAVFFTTEPSVKIPGVGQSVRLGSLLNIVNGTPTERKASITSVEANFFQFGDGISGRYSIKNTGDPALSTGFYPVTTIGLTPFASEQKNTATLVFAGRERTNDFMLSEQRFGFYKLRVSYGESTKEQWIFAVTGMWRYISLFVLVLTGVIAHIAYRRYRHHKLNMHFTVKKW